jgi:hypothetical protein
MSSRWRAKDGRHQAPEARPGSDAEELARMARQVATAAA